MDAYLTRVRPREAAKLSTAKGVRELLEAGAERQLALDEAWAGLHFLLSGEVPIPEPEARDRGLSWEDGSLENVLMGGEATPYKASLGPARYLPPARVKVLAEALGHLSADELLSRYDADALVDEGIPGDWEDPDEAQRWLRARYERLVAFYAAAASAGEGLLVHLL